MNSDLTPLERCDLKLQAEIIIIYCSHCHEHANMSKNSIINIIIIIYNNNIFCSIFNKA